MANEILKSHILETVDNQIKLNEPKCTRSTLNRLKELGYSEEKAREFIGAVLLEEMYNMMKIQEPFDEERYAEKLSLLPDYEMEGDSQAETKNEPILSEPKIGRNEQCPCGSGKKYKKCCGKY